LRRWAANWNSGGGWLSGLFWFVIVLCALIFGYFIGPYAATHPAPAAVSNATAVENAEKGK
jgi:hypothetical protein